MTAETRETKGQAALREQLKRNLSDAIVEMEVEEAERIAKEITAQGLFQMNLLETSVAAGMAVASRLYEEGEYFIPELLSCADAAEAATEIFRPYMLGEKPAPKGCVVIGSVEGDTHDIGKNRCTTSAAMCQPASSPMPSRRIIPTPSRSLRS